MINELENSGKADTHVHTKYSGFTKYSFAHFPESISEPDMVVKAAIRRGLDVLCITDHNTIAGALKAKKYAAGLTGFEVVIGEEVSTSEGEMIGLFLQDRIDPGLGAEETAQRLHEQGGIAIAPHPFSPHCPCLKQKVQFLDLDAVEVFNAVHRDPYSNRLASRKSVTNGKASTAGSDAHSLEMVGNAYTTFPGNSADELRTSILRKNTFVGGETTSLGSCIRWSNGVAKEVHRAIYRSLMGKIIQEDLLHIRIHRIKKRNKIIGFFGAAFYLFPPVSGLAGAVGEIITRKKAKMIWDEYKFSSEPSSIGDSNNNKIFKSWMNIDLISKLSGISKDIIYKEIGIEDSFTDNRESLDKLCIEKTLNCTQVVERLNQLIVSEKSE
ncbi:MAG: PHP domain-containing protein [Candidatus Methanoperedens sp.]|nr:PHP domain-containing protein [Candidatus Methanoperedens sp.]MCE8429152.1 PHP domain-containing protein [Candidatus Methanoperedens sp.]